MISPPHSVRLSVLCAALALGAACGESPDASENANAIIDPPAQCSPSRPDCSVSLDFPTGSDLNATNSAGLRFSEEGNALVVDRVSALPDADGDGVPDDADDCQGTPDWISCDGDPGNDGLYQTLFYDPSGVNEVDRRSIIATTAEIPQIDVYFLIDATMTLADEIAALQAGIFNIVGDVRSAFPDAQFGLGLYREYPLPDLAAAHSQAPYHHILDLTDDENLLQTAISTLNTVSNGTPASAATQALYSVATGLGLGDMVPNRGPCTSAEDADVGYPCFRQDALHVVVNITDAAVHNGPNPGGDRYPDAPFGSGAGVGVMDIPPVEMFPALFEADSAATRLDLGDLSGRSLTLMGMSTLLTDQVNTAIAPGCAAPPPVPPDDPAGADMDGKDVVLGLRFDSAVSGVHAFANNTHWPGANLALFDNSLLAPLSAIACDGGTNGVGAWGEISWTPIPSRQYFLVADGIIPANEPGHKPEGAFSISIVRDGDSPNPAWLTTDAPVEWNQVLTALLDSDIRVASIVTLRDAMSASSAGNTDARLMATATNALTKVGGQWVTELASANGEGLESAISNTIELAKTDSVYTISVEGVDNDATAIDERDLIEVIRHQDCAQTEPLGCDNGVGNRCRRCDVGAVLAYEAILSNTSVSPTGVAQVFDFEIVVRADDAVEVERIPVRVMVPDAASHEFTDVPGSNFYRNVYDSTARCITPPEHPKWGDLHWIGDTPEGSTIEFQIRTANTAAELQSAVPAVIVIPTDTNSHRFDITEELIADGQPYGLPYIQITAVLGASNNPPASPMLQGWSFEFVCEAAE